MKTLQKSDINDIASKFPNLSEEYLAYEADLERYYKSSIVYHNEALEKEIHYEKVKGDKSANYLKHTKEVFLELQPEFDFNNYFLKEDDESLYFKIENSYLDIFIDLKNKSRLILCREHKKEMKYLEIDNICQLKEVILLGIRSICKFTIVVEALDIVICSGFDMKMILFYRIRKGIVNEVEKLFKESGFEVERSI